ncbi:MAG: hypothetical protein ABJA37_04905 [Ferruginibacter sp.]
MQNKFKTLLAVAAFSLVIASCKKNKEEVNANEVITTVQLQLTPVGGGTMLTYKWEDLDGAGGSSPVIDIITLAPGKTYNTEIVIFDKTKNPTVVTSDEVRKEAIDHRFYFEPAAGSNITVSGLDNDPNGIPLGLKSVWTTGAASTGSIKITLRHYENGGKALADLINSTKSSTDAETMFSTKIQ